MASHTVALDDEAYRLLRRTRLPEESFSAVVKRLARPRKRISDLAGAWSDMTASEKKEMDQIYLSLREADRRRAELIRKAWG